jgi:hypothetical protein
MRPRSPATRRGSRYAPIDPGAEMRRRGQSTTEYLLTISVLSIAIASAMASFYFTMKSETEATGRSMAESLTTGGAQ